jgi:cytochrome c-type biogenesis protein CcmH/NrfG
MSFIEKISRFLLLSLLILAPLLVVPLTRNLIVDSKIFLVFVVTTLLVLAFALKTLIAQKWELAISPLTMPLVLFGISVAVSTFLANKYPVEALLGVGGIYLAMVIISIFAGALVKGDFSRLAVKLLSFTGALLSISMLLQFFGWGPTRVINSVSSFNLPHDLLFNLSGSSFVAVQVLAVAMVGLVATYLAKRTLTLIDGILGALMLGGLGVGVWSILPGKVAAVSITPFSASWTVMLRSLESLQSALIGNGPASYANLYARFKPLWTNGQAYWQFNFGTGMNAPLTLAVTIGLLGLAAWLFLLIVTVKQLKHSTKESKPLLWALIATFLIQLLVPTNIVILALQIPLIVLWVAANQEHFSLLQFRSVKVHTYPAKFEFIKKLAGAGNWFVRVTGLLLILGAIGLGYLTTRAYAAYHFMYRANQALAAQDAVSVYDNQRLAVQNNPYLDSLRREYAFTNLQIAIALANNADLADEEKQQVVQLISQAIREGKAATLLDSQDVDNWLALGEVYRNLIGAATEAGNWAVSSLVSAVQVNPINPLIRLQIGQLALNDGNAQTAVQLFTQAVQLKPDLPSVHYQLGLALRELGQLENARASWQRALELLPANADDYLTLSQQLEVLDQEIQATAATNGETTEETTPNVTEQNVQQQEADVVNPGEDAELNPQTVQ